MQIYESAIYREIKLTNSNEMRRYCLTVTRRARLFFAYRIWNLYECKYFCIQLLYIVYFRTIPKELTLVHAKWSTACPFRNLSHANFLLLCQECDLDQILPKGCVFDFSIIFRHMNTMLSKWPLTPFGLPPFVYSKIFFISVIGWA